MDGGQSGFTEFFEDEYTAVLRVTKRTRRSSGFRTVVKESAGRAIRMGVGAVLRSCANP